MRLHVGTIPFERISVDQKIQDRLKSPALLQFIKSLLARLRRVLQIWKQRDVLLSLILRRQFLLPDRPAISLVVAPRFRAPRCHPLGSAGGRRMAATSSAVVPFFCHTCNAADTPQSTMDLSTTHAGHPWHLGERTGPKSRLAGQRGSVPSLAGKKTTADTGSTWKGTAYRLAANNVNAFNRNRFFKLSISPNWARLTSRPLLASVFHNRVLRCPWPARSA